MLILNVAHQNKRSIMKEEVRWRGKADKEIKPSMLPCYIRCYILLTSAAALPKTAPPPPQSRFRVQWDLLFWMLASFAMLYFTDFASHLLFNAVVKR